MGQRSHIVYSHRAFSDGYSFFYLYYFPGEEYLTLRYSANGGPQREVSLVAVAMLDWIESYFNRTDEDIPELRPWRRAAKVLRLRLRQWMAAAAEGERAAR